MENPEKNKKDSTGPHKRYTKLQSDVTRSQYFKNILYIFAACSTIQDLQTRCNVYHAKILDDITGQTTLCIISDRMDFDDTSIDICPDDISGDQMIYPVKVKADDNCLLHCGGIFPLTMKTMTKKFESELLWDLCVMERIF